MLTVLFVCTGNICRSPIAEGLLAERSRRLLGGAVRVRSAGTWAMEGRPPVREAVHAGRERGVETGEMRSVPLTEDLIDEADLVVTMTSAQRHEVTELAPEARAKTFTLKGLSSLLGALPPPAATVEREAILDRIREADRLRSGRSAPDSGDEDVADPLGLPMEAFRAMTWEVELGVDRLVRGLFGAHEPARASGEGA